ncbi:MAG: polysaccharide deacetylase family protein [Clostridia bacterium]|nr:polysaccharide deacetylase family protein [Clostridia bacterium]
MYVFSVINRKVVLSLLISVCILFLSICVYAHTNLSENNPAEIPVPILMYHSILKDPLRAGAYVVSPLTLENDLIYIKEHGYETVFVSDLIAYVYEDKPLPEKPIVISFDDGHYNNLLYALPLLEKYDMKAVISVVGSYTEAFSKKDSHNPNYSYLTWEDISELQNSGRIEIANHTYRMHDSKTRNGSAIKKGETKSQYQKLLMEDLQSLQQDLEQKSKISPPKTFTYPYGYICLESQEVLEQYGFLASLSCYEVVSRISKDPASLYCLGRFNRPSGISTEKFMKKIQLP